MSGDNHKNIVSQLNLKRIILPVLIGLAIIVWFLLKDLNMTTLREIVFTWKSVFWLTIAWCCMIGRDLGYMIRIRILSEKDLTWRQRIC